METYLARKAYKFVSKCKCVENATKYIAKYAHLLFVIYGIILFVYPGKRQKERQKTCFSILFSIIISSIISFFIGKKFYRNRPFVKDGEIKNITNHKVNASFPSNHTMNGAIILFQLLKDKMPFAKVLIPVWILMSAARVFSGVHYISDLIGGIVIAKFVHKGVNGIFHKK